MTDTNQKQLGNTLWKIADDLRGAMNADDFRDYMLSFLFLRYLSDNYETAAKKELGRDYPSQMDSSVSTPLQLWYEGNLNDVPAFEKQMRRKVHYVIRPEHLWNSIANMARTQNGELLNTLQAGLQGESSIYLHDQSKYPVATRLQLPPEQQGDEHLPELPPQLTAGLFQTPNSQLEAQKPGN